MTEIILGILLLASNCLWAFLCIQLMDRLMSRNYVEFKQSKMIGKQQKPEKQDPEELVIDPIDALQAQEMNTMMGIA